MSTESYIVAGSKPWNRRVFEEVIRHYPGRWHFVGTPGELTPQLVAQISPRYIFFLHWSWKVPQELIDHYECVCFHMTDVPYGRGGSPLQNLILRGHHHTKLAAFRMVAELDAGPVYYKEDLCLCGSAEETYIRATHLASKMIHRIITEHPVPQPQVGTPVVFKRRKSEESRIPRRDSLQALYDFIRMLDAQGYPRAFLEHEGFRYEFRRAQLYDGEILADVRITPLKRDNM